MIHRAGDRDGFGLTKLFKVLWFFEAKRFSIEHETFSGAEYTRDEHGPRPTLAYTLLPELEASGAIQRYSERYYNHDLRRARSLRPPATGLLNEDQARDLEYWINYVDGVSATQISEESHDYGWEIAKQGEKLPLVAFLASRVRDPNQDELAWAKERAKALGLP